MNIKIKTNLTPVRWLMPSSLTGTKEQDFVQYSYYLNLEKAYKKLKRENSLLVKALEFYGTATSKELDKDRGDKARAVARKTQMGWWV